MTLQEKIEKIVSLDIKKDVRLKDHTTLGVGGLADYYFKATTLEELVEAIAAARKTGTRYKVIGNGSNLVISDSGFEGMIIKNVTGSLSIDVKTGRVIAESGVSLSRLILEAASNGLGGLEPLYGIPATVGGAVVGNAGAHGASISQYLKSSSVMLSSEKIMNCKTQWFKFGYRESILKHERGGFPPVILNAIFQFQHRKKDDALEDIAKYKKWRVVHQPLGEKTCASIFKNPVGTDDAEVGDQREKTAGYLLEQSGAKKLIVGGARVSNMHANWIANAKNASAHDVRELIEKMRDAVEQKFQITLVEEVEYIGSWSNDRKISD